VKLPEMAKSIPEVRVEELTKRIEDNDINFGDFIDIEGHFSQYSHAILPYTYLFESADRGEIVSRIPIPGAPFVQENMKMGFRTLQLPVSSFPQEASTGKNLGFLYSVHFNGFRYDDISRRTECQEGRSRVPFRIPDFAKPIPVIYDSERHASFLERNVFLRGKVIPIRHEHVSKILKGDTREVFTRPIIVGNDVSSYYGISLIDEGASVRHAKNRSSPRKQMTVFFEFDLQCNNKNINTMEIISKALPDVRPQMKVLQFQSHIDYFMFVTLGHIRVIGRSPGSFGLFQNIDSFSNQKKSIRSICSYYRLIHNNLRDILKGEDFSITPTFMFRNDYSILFSRDGSFHNDEIYEAIRDYNRELSAINPKYKHFMK
jgi:hypothetical protein